MAFNGKQQNIAFHLREAQNGPIIAESDAGAIVATKDMAEMLNTISRELAPILDRQVRGDQNGILMTITLEAFEG